MNLRTPAAPIEAPQTLMSWTDEPKREAGELPGGEASSAGRVAGAGHAGFLAGATVTGEAARQRLAVRVGIWLDDAGQVRQARWRAVKDPALRACAEAACALLESGTHPALLDAEAIRRAVPDRAAAGDGAEVVVAAVQAGMLSSMIAAAR